MKLDDIGHAVETKRGRLERECAGGAEIAARFAAGLVGTVVEDAALGGEGVFGPLTLDVDKRALAGAKREMLECREREGVVGSRHGSGAGRNRTVSACRVGSR